MIVLMGAAGAGKGTQGQLLVEDKGYDYISTGEMLRQYATPEQKSRMIAGELLGDEEIIAMVDKALTDLGSAGHCILDGFPRTANQVNWLMEQVAAGRFQVRAVINLTIPKEVILQRLRRRGREDDSEAVIERRFSEYQSITLPVLDCFREVNVPVHDINADQAPVAVHQEILQALGEA